MQGLQQTWVCAAASPSISALRLDRATTDSTLSPACSPPSSQTCQSGISLAPQPRLPLRPLRCSCPWPWDRSGASAATPANLFTPAELLEHHETCIDSRSTFACAYAGCIAAYPTTVKLKQHVQWMHLRRGFKCPISDCRATKKSRHALIKHLFGHLDLTPFPCRVGGCRNLYRAPDGELYHYENTHLQLRWQCPHPACRMPYHSRRKLVKHCAQHGPLECECTEVFTDVDKLGDHMPRVHQSTSPFRVTLTPATDNTESATTTTTSLYACPVRWSSNNPWTPHQVSKGGTADISRAFFLADKQNLP
ncbi:hypothetical protein DFJ77DRAFT_92254 [Powellomyces hirtus]|nr:hypothetical protein DFJ77DRAFT_92254 [Powellomyces hirtus]